jgi:hypothetical protein
MHRTPTSNDDPTVVHEITEQLSPAAPAADEAAPTVDPTPAGVPDAGDASEPSAPLAGSGAGSDAAGSGRPPPKRRLRHKIRDLFRSPAQTQLAEAVRAAEAELPGYSAAAEEIETDARRYLDAQHERIYAAFVLLVTYLRIVEARSMLDRYTRNTHTADPTSVASWLLVRRGNDGDGAP